MQLHTAMHPSTKTINQKPNAKNQLRCRKRFKVTTSANEFTLQWSRKNYSAAPIPLQMHFAISFPLPNVEHTHIHHSTQKGFALSFQPLHIRPCLQNATEHKKLYPTSVELYVEIRGERSCRHWGAALTSPKWNRCSRRPSGVYLPNCRAREVTQTPISGCQPEGLLP